MELAALQEVLPRIKARGAALAAISPQRPEFLKQMRKKHNLSFDLLIDKGNRVAEQFGLVYKLPDYLREIYLEVFRTDLARFNGDDSWTLPIPARFIIDQDAAILSVHADPDYTIRPEPELIVEFLGNLTSS